MKKFLLVAIALAAMVGANATTDNEYIRDVSSGNTCACQSTVR